MRQIPYVPLRNSKQLAHKLKLAVGQRTEVATNVQTDDGLTNGASNIIKLIQLTDEIKPLGLIWVQFDYEVLVEKLVKKTECFMSEELKAHGHQLNLSQPNFQLVERNLLKLLGNSFHCDQHQQKLFIFHKVILKHKLL
jgi:hypothetical protein